MARSVVGKQVTCPIYLPADLGRSGPLPSLSFSICRMGATVTAQQDPRAESGNSTRRPLSRAERASVPPASLAWGPRKRRERVCSRPGASASEGLWANT